MIKILLFFLMIQISSFLLAFPTFTDENGRNEKNKIISIKDLSFKEQSLILKDTEIKNDGYIKVIVPDTYFNILNGTIQSFDRLKKQSLEILLNGFFDGSEDWKLISIEGIFGEDGALLFGSKFGERILYTHREINTNGFGTVRIREFLNQEVDGNAATLSLVITVDKTASMWKVTWQDTSTLSEFYLTESFSNQGEPSRQPSQVIEIATKFSKNSNAIKSLVKQY
ncbi:MAG: hypothetical protein V4695_10740 [Pseudomonadota bacterium]